MTQALILAGGLGTRLWPLTKEVPKPMVPVAGKPYLEHQLVYLAEQGICDIVLSIGYLGDQIEQHFGSGAKWGVSITYAREQSPLGTGGAVREARNLLAEKFLLLYGDCFLPIRYFDILATLEDKKAWGVVTVYDNQLDDTSVKNNIALDERQFVRLYEKDSDNPELTYVEAGASAFRREMLDLIPPEKVSLEQQIFPQLIARHNLAAYITQRRFYDIGTPDRLELINSYFSS